MARRRSTGARARDLRSVYRAAYRAALPLHRYYRRRLLARARDVTAALERGAALVVAPHADDDVLGCGATIARKRAHGERVRIVYATDGTGSHAESEVARERLAALRRAEAVAGAAALGVPERDLRFLGLPDRRLRAEEERLTHALVRELHDFSPRLVFVASALDFHPDHQASARAARRAALEAGFRGLFYEYPVWYWRHLPWTHRPAGIGEAAWHFLRDPAVEWWRGAGPRWHLVRAEGHLEAKRAALAAHASQVTGIDGGEPPLDPSFVAEFVAEAELFIPVRLGR